MLSEADMQKWDEMMVRYGPYKMAEKIHKLKSYKKFIRKYPYDGKEEIVSLDRVNAEGLSLAEALPDESPSILDQIMSDEAVDEIMSGLTTEQRRIVFLLKSGWKSKEIFAEFGYKSTNGIRQQRSRIRKKRSEAS